MKKTLFVLAVAAVLVVASCATAPEAPAPVEEPAPPAKEPAPPAKAPVALPETEYAQAKELKTTIDRHGLDAYAPEDYKKAEASLAEAEKVYRTDNAAAKRALDEAIRGYNAVIAKGFPALTAERRQRAEAEKAQADALKAQRAVPDGYARAKARYDEAVAAEKAGEFAKAIAAFDDSQRLFRDVHVQAQARKDRAEQAMRTAQQELEEAERRARAADAEIQSAQ